MNDHMLTKFLRRETILSLDEDFREDRLCYIDPYSDSPFYLGMESGLLLSYDDVYHDYSYENAPWFTSRVLLKSCLVKAAIYKSSYLRMSSNSLCKGTDNNTDSLGSDKHSDSAVLFESPKMVKYGLDAFHIFSIIGIGTFGKVYLSCSKQNLDRYFAIKVMKKLDIVRLNQVEHVCNERDILQRVSFPFIIHLFGTFQTKNSLYFVLEYAIGGELFSYLRKVARFSVEVAKFYASEVVLAIEHLHTLNIVYRDLKPENILLDRNGHIKITDFGFSKRMMTDRTWTVCGTPEYLAPEIVKGTGHDRGVDWWSLGILLYEMLVGTTPFYDSTPLTIYEKVTSGVISFPHYMDPVSIDLISKLLNIEKGERLGCGRKGVEEIKEHPWFKDVQWEQVLERSVDPPFRPYYAFPGDVGNYEVFPGVHDDSEIIDTNVYDSMFSDF